jgi:hypothetical protein
MPPLTCEKGNRFCLGLNDFSNNKKKEKEKKEEEKIGS